VRQGPLDREGVVSAPAVDFSGFAWARLQACEEDAAACSSLIRHCVAAGGRLPIREAALLLNLTSTTTRGLASRLVESGLVALAGDSVWLLPMRQERPRA
jgi:hypothetical protein